MDRDRPPRELSLARADEGASEPAACLLTGVTIPECSCPLCIEAQIRHHSPELLVRRMSDGHRDAAA